MFLICTYRKQFVAAFIAILSFAFVQAQNPIVTENALPGSPESEWQISGSGDLSIQGFATDISVNKGETIHFKINTDATGYSIDIYRIGYYNGDGARHIGTGIITVSLPQIQPDPITDVTTGLVDCGNWGESAHWDVPSNAISGVYIAKLSRIDNGGASHIIFVVRDDVNNSDLFFKTSDATWQAYNVYGGNSAYVGNTSYPNGHGVKLSYNRPFLTRSGGGGGTVGGDFFFNAEYPMIRFLERNGYNISYTTDVDAARNGNLLLNHNAFLSVGHDEYWSAAERTNVETALNAGIHLAFFSGNEVYWKTRWENSVDGSATPYRTLVCYKEGTLGENSCNGECDPSAEWTGLWRDGCNIPGSDGCKPENSLTGQKSWTLSANTSINVPGTYKSLRFWRNTSIATTGIENVTILPQGTLGYEWDFEQFDDYYPSGRITLSSTTIDGKTHKLSLYKHNSGALVFGAGTMQWAWGLDSVHDRGNEPASKDIQQATINLFADMNILPASLQANLIPAVASTDYQPPSTSILTPLNEDSLPSSPAIIISGISNDDNVVAGVEVSTDGGLTWKKASGSSAWTFSWLPDSIGTYIIKARAFDDSGNMEVAGSNPGVNTITINIVHPECPCMLYETNLTPSDVNTYDSTQGLELGTKFRAATDGFITALRFYKSSKDTGTHIGSMWTLNGILLGQAIFSNESDSGWQETRFQNPIAITANTTYIASYHSTSGYYSVNQPFFTSEYVKGPLRAIATTDSVGPNGVYSYSNSPAFPTDSYNSSNYWVDVVFTYNSTDTTGPSVTSINPNDYSSGVNVNSSINVSFSENIDQSTLNSTTVELIDAFGLPVPSLIDYNQGMYSFTLTPITPLDYSRTYKLNIKSGAFGVKDIGGNALSDEISNTFKTADASVLSPQDGPGGPILVIHSSTNPFGLYTAEILRAEGLNEFATAEISSVTSTMLNNYDVVILGEMTATAPQVSMLTNWVNAGGKLIAFRPSANLNALFGISPSIDTLNNKYLLVNTASGPGVGIVNETIQYHGTADLHTLNGATSLATLYSDASTATAYPAVTTINVGSSGGKAIAFTYDLPKSIIYTRQGNPAWVGQKRDGTTGPTRSDDMYYGNALSDPQPDWIDFNKIAIPQADEQQRFLANIILQYNLSHKPLPRFWYLPRELKAVVIMTGDDHANNGTLGRFTYYKTLGPNSPADVANWDAIRGTSYMYPNTPITNTQATSLQDDGFELALHPSTGCGNYTETSLTSVMTSQLASFGTNFPGLTAPVTNRTHCMPWSDWASHAKVEAQKGMRLDVNYYYWPGNWLQNRPGMFTGSGMPMRFADIDGTMIDCYQATTQMTDESGITVGSFCSILLDKAIGPEGYYGVFTANMHTDTGANHAGSIAIINAALARQVPVISAKQMLEWLDGRNNSSFGSINWAGNVLSFTITAASGSNNLRAMLPTHASTGTLTQIARAGTPLAFTIRTIKGIEYAFFDASVTGSYTATYGATSTITGNVVLQGRPAAPDTSWVVPVQVDLYETGNATPVATFITTTNSSGQFFITGVPEGTFNIKVKSTHTLARVINDKSITSGNNTMNFGTLLEGDVNGDNYVSALDLGPLLSSYNKIITDPGFLINADLNGDEFVSALDLGLLLANYNTPGEEPQ